MSYKLDFSTRTISKLELLSKSNPKLLSQIFRKTVSLRRNPYPQDYKEIKNYVYGGLQGLRVDQGEYRIIYVVDEPNHEINIIAILNRNDDYKELRCFKQSDA